MMQKPTGLTAEDRQKLKKAGYTDEDIVGYEAERFGKKAGPTAEETREPEKAPSSFSAFGAMKSAGKFLAKGVMETAAQPARFLERTGKAIGTMGLSEERKQQFEEYMGPGFQERVGGEEYATPAYRTAGQVAGGALQTATHLATPATFGVGRLAASGGVLGFGAALEEGQSPQSAAMSGIIGTAGGALIGKGGQLGSAVAKKGVGALKEVAKETLKPIARRLAPAFTGVSKKELATAFDVHPEKTLKMFDALRNADDPAAAESVIRGHFAERGRAIVDSAKKKAGSEFESAIKPLEREFADARGNISRIAKEVDEMMPRFGRPASTDERIALEGVGEILREPRETTISGVRTLLEDLWTYGSRLEKGTPARAAVDKAWGKVRDELSAMTKGKIDPAMAKYAAFKKDLSNVRPLWAENITEDATRNFVNTLTGAAKTGSREAMERIGKIVGEDVVSDVTVARIARKLAVDQKITGSRLGELIVGGSVFAGAGTIGEWVGGSKGRGVGQAAGALLMGKALAPKALTNILLSSVDDLPIKMTGAVRQKLGEVFQNPAFLNVLHRALRGGPDAPDTEGAQEGTGDTGALTDDDRRKLKDAGYSDEDIAGYEAERRQRMGTDAETMDYGATGTEAAPPRPPAPTLPSGEVWKGSKAEPQEKKTIGGLSEKYESKGNPGAIGHDRTGGWSYGTYQLAHDNAKKFVESSPYAKEFRGLAFNSEAWRNKWKAVAKKDPKGFAAAQHGFIEKTHYAPQEKKIEKSGLSLAGYSDVLKDVIWSTAVQHGSGTDIVVKALKAVGKGAKEADVIKKIYEYRWGGGKRFASSTPAVRNAVKNRFFGKGGEQETALKRLT